MPTTMYSLYVGHYSSPSVSKSDVARLNQLGMRGFLFSRGDYYALKVYSSPNPDNIQTVKNRLRDNGFEVEVETIELKKS